MFFLRLYRFQSYPFESKFFFTLIMLLRLVFKDGFIMIFFMFPLAINEEFKEIIFTYALELELPIVIILGMVILLGFLALGSVANNN